MSYIFAFGEISWIIFNCNGECTNCTSFNPALLVCFIQLLSPSQKHHVNVCGTIACIHSYPVCSAFIFTLVGCIDVGTVAQIISAEFELMCAAIT